MKHCLAKKGISKIVKHLPVKSQKTTLKLSIAGIGMALAAAAALVLLKVIRPGSERGSVLYYD